MSTSPPPTESDSCGDRPLFKVGMVLLLALACFGVISLWGAGSLLDSFAPSSRAMLAIILLGLSLWASDFIPAYATGLLLIVLQMMTLGDLGQSDSSAWKSYLATLGSPLIWMFMGAFAIGRAAEKTGLASSFAQISLRPLVHRRKGLLIASLGIAFFMSMLLSNTATAAIMLALLTPLLSSREIPVELKRGLLLGVASGASLGGMGTLIGSPANLIAAEALSGTVEMTFARWLTLGLPPAIVIAVLAGIYLWFTYFSKATRESLLAISHAFDLPAEQMPNQRLRRHFTSLVFVGTVLLWSTESLHHLPPAPVALFAFLILLISGILSSDDVRQLPWETLLLIASGLSLGSGMNQSGLTQELAGLVPQHASPLLVVILLTVLAVLLSNVISNTAAAAILVPLAIGLTTTSGDNLLGATASVGLACSCALLLPVSTPPNAIVFSTGHLNTKHFLSLGLLVGLLGPAAIVFWTNLIT